MTTPPAQRPSYKQMVDLYFLEHRAKLVDIAAFLDRLDRANPNHPADQDYRLLALQSALTILIDGQGDRAKRVLEHFSDPTAEPIKTPGPPASGAYPPNDVTDPTHRDATGHNP